MEIQKGNTEGTRKGRRRDYTWEVRKPVKSKRTQLESTKQKIRLALKGKHNSVDTQFKKGHKSYPRTKKWREDMGKKMKESWIAFWQKYANLRYSPNLLKSRK